MKTRTRALTLLGAAAMMVVGAIGAAAPVAATPAQDTITVSDSVATYNAAAIANEATADHTDNVSCTIGGWVAANSPRVVIPGVNTTHGQDAGSADGTCSNLDPVNPQRFRAFLDVAFEYLPPGGTDGDWVEYDRDGCVQIDTSGHAVFPQCTFRHMFFDPSDPIQGFARRAIFELGVLDDTGAKDVRSTRAFGPVSPHPCAIVFEPLPDMYWDKEFWDLTFGRVCSVAGE